MQGGTPRPPFSAPARPWGIYAQAEGSSGSAASAAASAPFLVGFCCWGSVGGLHSQLGGSDPR
eukprot:10954685-Alexandrium_andersonii.AAC.1